MNKYDHKISQKNVIKQLDETVINKIAAGEVVERPASAVKELIENSIDAGCSDITIEVADGGKTLIRVIDDGLGMSDIDLPIALRRHATSKLPNDNLLNINSFGFRGEALPSLGAVGRLRIISHNDCNGAHEINVNGGKISDIKPAARTLGTTIELRDLFYATPARLKFLRSTKSELKAITDTVKGLSISTPNVAFTLIDKTGGKSRKILQVQKEKDVSLASIKNRLSRDLGQDLIVSTKQARALLIPLKAQDLKFKAIGLDATKLKTTLAAISDEFGSLENVTARNAANVSRLAQNTGVSGKEIVQFNKVMMDLTGASFDVATNIAPTAADLAKSANVATGKVLSDIASNAEKFSKFSMAGANGLAEAAIEAAKIGGSLETILRSADKLLEFESSLTAQFKAQVLTGKQLNLERARQLSLEGDIAGFTQEIQSVIGGLGDLQALNVVQRQAVADAIGVSVRELQRIAAGEQAEERETVQDKIDVSNGLLREIAGYTSETAAKDNSVEVIQPVF